ncbi:MAG: hypothetical protein LBS81_06330 [Endomicrobium sp.]|jgi:hypothetical protein|nr:hypothetical protein [Endomicrobium sp.]
MEEMFYIKMAISHQKQRGNIGKVELCLGLEWKTLDKMEGFYLIQFNILLSKQ